MVVLGGEVVTQERFQAASAIEKLAMRWNALVQAHEAAEAYSNLIGSTWTGRTARRAAA